MSTYNGHTSLHAYNLLVVTASTKITSHHIQWLLIFYFGGGENKMHDNSQEIVQGFCFMAFGLAM